MNRIVLSLCFLAAACGEVVDIDPSALDAGTNTGGDGGAGGPDSGPGDPCVGPSIELENLETCFRQMQCEFMVRCFPGFPTVEFCEPRIFDFFSHFSTSLGGGDDDGPTKLFFDIIAKASSMDVATYNGARAFGCLEDLRDSSCKQDGSNDDCDYILSGSVGQGGNCFDDFECLPGAHCARDGEGLSCDIVGTCQAGVAKGGSCANGLRCLPELECVTGNQGGSPTCEDGSLNSKCEEDDDCDAQLHCQSKTCAADVAVNGACLRDDQCPGDQLCLDMVCSDVSAIGDACRGRCFGNLYCDEEVTQQCQALPGPNEICSLVPGGTLSQCGDVDHVCRALFADSRCVPRIPLTMMCGQDPSACALGTFCTSELGSNEAVCAAPMANSNACGAAKHCASGLCASSDSDSQTFCTTHVACWE